MNPLAIFKRKPREIVTVRASHKAFREAEATYAGVHAKLAQELGRPVPSHLSARVQKGKGNA